MKNIHILPTDKQIKNVGDLVKDEYGDIHIFTKNDGKEYGKTTTKLNIYITSYEEIKEGDYYLELDFNIIYKFTSGTFTDINSKKIILTTDADLIKEGVQAIDDTFLEWFIKNPSCEEVQVERFHGINTSIAEINAISGDSSLNWQGRSDLRDYKIIIPKEESKAQGYICPQTKNQCDDECCVSAEDCHIKASIGVLEEPKQETLEEAEKEFKKLINGKGLPTKQLLEVAEHYFIVGYETAKERSYSEEDLKEAFKQSRQCKIFENDMPPVYSEFEDWFEQFKK